MPYTYDWNAIATGGGALATLIVGMAAVRAAKLVGFKQAGIQSEQASIAERQTDILAKQVDLANATLRSELFERRIDIFANATDFLILMEVYAKGGAQDEVLAFSVDVRLSRFLFRSEVHEAMREIWGKFQKLKIAKQKLNSPMALYETPETEKTVMRKEIDGILAWRDDRLETLTDLFADDLTIEADATNVAIR